MLMCQDGHCSAACRNKLSRPATDHLLLVSLSVQTMISSLVCQCTELLQLNTCVNLQQNITSFPYILPLLEKNKLVKSNHHHDMLFNYWRFVEASLHHLCFAASSSTHKGFFQGTSWGCLPMYYITNTCVLLLSGHYLRLSAQVLHYHHLTETLSVDTLNWLLGQKLECI